MMIGPSKSSLAVVAAAASLGTAGWAIGSAGGGSGSTPASVPTSDVPAPPITEVPFDQAIAMPGHDCPEKQGGAGGDDAGRTGPGAGESRAGETAF